jgi:GNAT superfamily N-acetyltransferase
MIKIARLTPVYAPCPIGGQPANPFSMGIAMQYEIVVTDDPDSTTEEAIRAQLITFNEKLARPKMNSRPLAVLISAPSTKEIIGGLFGSTYYSFLHVDLLFVPKNLRGAGLGKDILERAEHEALQRGCRGSWLDTFDWQARGFYEKLGYTLFGTLENYPPGHTRFFLTKLLR